MELICIPPTDVAKIWLGEIESMIDAAFAASDVPMPDDILGQLTAGTRQLWVAVTPEARIVAAMMTQLFPMRHGKLLKMMECGGSEMATWLPLRAKIEQYARDEGCDRVQVTGRWGWRGVLKDYRIVGVTLEKRI
jgi:hypothetical protein